MPARALRPARIVPGPRRGLVSSRRVLVLVGLLAGVPLGGDRAFFDRLG